MPDVGDGVRIVRMVRREAIPRHMSIGVAKVKSLIAYAGSNRCVTCATLLAILRGPAPIGTNVFSVGSRVTSREIALKKMVIGTVILWRMYQAPPLLKPLAVPLLPLFHMCLVQNNDAPLHADADSLDFCRRCDRHWSCLGYPAEC